MSKLHRELPNEQSLNLAQSTDVFVRKALPLTRPVNVVFAVAAAIYLAIFAYCAVGASILEPYSDMIDLIDDYFHAVDRGAPVDYLLDPHNLHRLPWFRTLIALDVSMLRGTGVPLVVVGGLCLGGTALLLVLEVRRVGENLPFPLMVLMGMLVFLTANSAGVSVPANTPHLNATFFSVLALVTAASAGDQNSNWSCWVAAMAYAAAASFSLATALVLWPILILMSWRSKTSWWITVLVAVGGGAFCAAYVAGQSLGTSLQAGLDSNGLVKAVEYFLAYLGLPWARGSLLLGELIGGGLLVASLFALSKYGLTKTNRTQRLALGMILFSLGGAALAAIGRRDITVEVDIPVRYAILLVPLHAGLLLLIVPGIIRNWNSRPRFTAGGLIAILAFLIVQQVVVGTVVVRAGERARQTIAAYQQGERTPEMLQWIYPDLDRAAHVYAEMRRRGVFLQWVEGLKDPTSAELTGD